MEKKMNKKKKDKKLSVTKYIQNIKKNKYSILSIDKFIQNIYNKNHLLLHPYH